MKISKTCIDDLLIIEPQLYRDDRGFFYESFNKNKLDKTVKAIFVQDNESKSYKGVIRGLHFQKPPHAQAKLVRCVTGKILDIAVDLRKNSKTYGKSFSVELSSENNKQMFIPIGFAHGFQVLSNEAIVSYKVSEYYNSDSDSGIIWNDKDLSIKWNLDLIPVLSDKDLKLNLFKNLKSPF